MTTSQDTNTRTNGTSGTPLSQPLRQVDAQVVITLVLSAGEPVRNFTNFELGRTDMNIVLSILLLAVAYEIGKWMGFRDAARICRREEN